MDIRKRLDRLQEELRGCCPECAKEENTYEVLPPRRMTDPPQPHPEPEKRTCGTCGREYVDEVLEIPPPRGFRTAEEQGPNRGLGDE